MRSRPEGPRLDLGGSWSFVYSDLPIPAAVLDADGFVPDGLADAGLTVYPATVPGNFELDLHANGLIEEPFVSMNIADLRRFETSYATYVRTFAAPPDAVGVPYLVLEGVDCFADILLNGQLIQRADNMPVEHHIPVGDALRAGAENTLVVAFRPAVGAARSREAAYPPGLEAEPSGEDGLYVRKAPHMYGWDIMPRALSMGLWRPVELRYLPVERLDWVWLDTESLTRDGAEARLALHYRAEIAGPGATYAIEVEARCDEARFSHSAPVLFEAGTMRFRVPSPRPWWPRGRGAAHLYEVAVRLRKDGRIVDMLTFTHGIRTVELDRTSVTNESGDGEFCFRINGEQVFILGTNWVPLDAYHSRDVERIEPVLDMVEDLGCNLIRCWGGNVYENDRFYDSCDRRGILVWQDFAFACAIYPQDEAFQAIVRAEATQVVRRLRQHASLAIWAGDNECDTIYTDLGRRRDPNTNVLTRHVLPAVLRDEDPSRPYLPSSPYIDETAFRVGEAYLPENHLWGPRDYYKSAYYVEALAHFASEMGYHGCPEPASLRRFLSPGKVWPPTDNEEWLLHCTSPIPGVDTYDYRVPLMLEQVRVLFGKVPDDLGDFAYASQASQAEAMKFFIEMFRAAKWRRTGIVWWNIADGWPQFSDAIVDYYGAKKRAYDVIKRSQAPLCLVLREPSGGRQQLVSCNDTRDDLAFTFTIRDIASGEVVAEGRASAAADEAIVVAEIGAAADMQRCYALEWESALGVGRSHYIAGTPPFDLERYRAWMESAGL